MNYWKLHIGSELGHLPRIFNEPCWGIVWNSNLEVGSVEGMWIVWFGNLSGSTLWICLCECLSSAHYRSFYWLFFQPFVLGNTVFHLLALFMDRSRTLLAASFSIHCVPLFDPPPPSFKLSLWWTVVCWPSCLSSASLVIEPRATCMPAFSLVWKLPTLAPYFSFLISLSLSDLYVGGL